MWFSASWRLKEGPANQKHAKSVSFNFYNNILFNDVLLWILGC